MQVKAVGGRIVEIDGTFSAAYAHAVELAAQEGHVLVNSTNPHRIEGQMTAAFEILEQLGGLPDVLTLPYGGGGNTKAYARGFMEAAGALPRLHPVEAAQRADTVASAIRIVDPIHRPEVEEAIERSFAPAAPWATRKGSSASPRRRRGSPDSSAGRPPPVNASFAS